MKIAFVFPGQGSQSVGMMKGFDEHPAVRETFDEASSVLGQDLWTLVTQGPQEDLDLTVNTQPVMLAAGVAVWRAWMAAGGRKPGVLAGHSLGEYSALVASGALAFRDAVPLVRFRAQAMQDAVPVGTGAMAAILGLDDETVRAACQEAAQGEVVEAVNFNAPNQVVIAGHRSAVERGIEVARAKGARRAVLLPVSAPFHSSLLRPAAERLAAHLREIPFGAPRVPLVNNVDVAIVTESAQIKDALARQACRPVRWVEVIRHMVSSGVTHIAECGPGKVLAGLTKRIDGTLESYAITDPVSLQQLLEATR